MTNKVSIEITTCNECPHWDAERYYTADSWEHIMEWKCRLSGKSIALVETFDDDPSIPEDCPLLKKNT